MRKWKIGFFVLLTLLVCSNLGWVFLVIDQSITLTYQQESFNSQQKTIGVMGDLLVDAGREYSKKDILHLLRQKYPDEFIVEDVNKIQIENVRFVFKHNKLVAVN